MAMAFVTAGNHGEALKLYQRALEGTEYLRGANDPLTLEAVDNVARTLFLLGNHEEALKLFKRLFDSRYRGEDYLSVLEVVSSIALNLSRQGNYEGAIKYHELARDGYSISLGQNHESTVAAIEAIHQLSAKLGKSAWGSQNRQTPDSAKVIRKFGQLSRHMTDPPSYSNASLMASPESPSSSFSLEELLRPSFERPMSAMDRPSTPPSRPMSLMDLLSTTPLRPMSAMDRPSTPPSHSMDTMGQPSAPPPSKFIPLSEFFQPAPASRPEKQQDYFQTNHQNTFPTPSRPMSAMDRPSTPPSPKIIPLRELFFQPPSELEQQQDPFRTDYRKPFSTSQNPNEFSETAIYLSSTALEFDASQSTPTHTSPQRPMSAVGQPPTPPHSPPAANQQYYGTIKTPCTNDQPSYLQPQPTKQHQQFDYINFRF